MPQSPLAALFAGHVRARRESFGWSAQDLADRCEASGSRINRDVIASIETGRRQDVTLDEAACLAYVFANNVQGTDSDGDGGDAVGDWLVNMLAAAVMTAGTDDLPPDLAWLRSPASWLAPAPPPDSAAEFVGLTSRLHALVRDRLRIRWADLPDDLTWADVPKDLTWADLAAPNSEA